MSGDTLGALAILFWLVTIPPTLYRFGKVVRVKAHPEYKDRREALGMAALLPISLAFGPAFVVIHPFLVMAWIAFVLLAMAGVAIVAWVERFKRRDSGLS